MNKKCNHGKNDRYIKVGTIEKKYGVDLGARSDMKLGNYLKKEGLPSMSKALKSVEKKSSKK